MQKRVSQSFLQGAVILTASTMLVKFIGIFYKIPLGNMLGATGMSYFMTAYHIFNPIFALSAAGFPAAVSKMVSESVALGRYGDVRKIFRVAMLLFLLLGAAGFLALLFAGGTIAARIGNPQAALAVTAIAPSLFFCCVMSAYRGYYQGLGNMGPTAASQVLEALTKLVLGIGLAFWVLETGLSGYAENGRVFGAVIQGGMEQAQLAVLPYAAAGAVLGVTASAALGTLFLFLRHLLGRGGVSRKLAKSSPEPAAFSVILKRLLSIALPVCLASAVGHITTLIDVATVMNRIGVAIQRDSAAVLAMYAGLIPAHTALEGIPSYLYGAFSYTSSFFNLVPALTVTLGISALPALSANCALRGYSRLEGQLQSLIKLAALLSIPAGIGLAALPGSILALLYPNLTQEVAIATPLLRSMGIAAVFAGIAAPLSSVFQAIGRADIPVKLMCLGGIVKIAANYVLLAIPSINIYGTPVGTILCYVLFITGSLFFLQRLTDVRIHMVHTFIKPLICGILCGVAANTSYQILARLVPGSLAVLISIAIGCLVYAIFVLFLKIITKNEAILLPNGKKIVKILEKLSLLG